MFFFPNKPIQIYDPDKLLVLLRHQKNNWIVQPKWNGKRVEIACDNNIIRMTSREGNYWSKESASWVWLRELPLPQPWFLDGEMLRDGRVYVWDYAVLGGQRTFKTPYKSRLKFLQTILPFQYIHSPQKLYKTILAVTETLPITKYKKLLKRSNDKFIEGVVWKNLSGMNFWDLYKTGKVATQFKYRF